MDLDVDDYNAIESLLSSALKRRDNSDAHICQARLLIRKNDLIDVESHLNRAYQTLQKQQCNQYRLREYYLITGNPVLGLKAFQSALDASTKDSPEYAQIKRYVEQVTAILAAQANVNYAQIGEDNINVVSETVTERPNVMIRKEKQIFWKSNLLSGPYIKGPLWTLSYCPISIGVYINAFTMFGILLSYRYVVPL